MQIYNVSDDRLEQLLALQEKISSGDTPPTPECKRQQIAINRKKQGQIVGVIPIVGSLIDRASVWEEYGVCTSYESIEACIDQAVAKGVNHIVLDIDSGGGYAVGIDVACNKIQEAKTSGVLFTAQVHNFACSAAYELACCCDKIYAPKSAIVGSIGSVMYLYDTSEQCKKEGVRPVVISTGKFKAIGAPGTVITKEMEDKLAESGEYHFEAFKAVVASGRSLSMEAVDKLSTGETWTGIKALELGLIDGISDYENTIKSIQKGSNMTDKEEGVKNAVELNTPASVAEIEKLLKNATADFKWNCVKNAYTVEQVKDAYVASLEAENEALKAKLNAAQPIIENKTTDQKLTIAGNHTGVPVEGVMDAAKASPRAVAEGRVKKLMNEQNIPEWQAYSVVFANDPELEKEYNDYEGGKE